MQKLIEVADPDLLTSGILLNTPTGQTGLWRDAENFLFLDNGVEKVDGWDVIVTKGSPIYAIEQAYVDGETRSYYAGATEVWRRTQLGETSLGAGFSGGGYWSLLPWGNWLIATNDFDVPQVWKNTGSLVPLGGVPVPRFRLLKKMQNQVLGFIGQQLYFSNRSDPETWTAAENNTAGNFFIRDLDGDVVSVQPLGSAMGLYSADTLTVLQYVGPDAYFGTPGTPLNGVGALSDASVVPVASKNYGLSRKGAYVTDGVSFADIGAPAINRWLKANINMAEARRTIGFHWERRTMVCWWFTALDGSRKGLGYNYVNRAWTRFASPVWSASEEQVLSAPLIGVGNSLATLGTVPDAGGENLPGFLQTFPADAGQRERYKTWQMLRFDGTALGDIVGSVQFRVGFSDFEEEDPDWWEWRDLLTENWLMDSNGYDRESVFLTIEFRVNETGSYLRIGKLAVHGIVGGML